MVAVLKSRVPSALLVVLLLASGTNARAADAPPRRGQTASFRNDEVGLSRVSRHLSRQEIFQAIQSDLARMGVSGREGLRPGDLIIQSSLPAPENDMGLRVKRIGYDPLRRETVFQLWTSHEPQYLPFEVATRRDPRSWGIASRPGWKMVEEGGEPVTKAQVIGNGVSQVHPKLPVLAKPGKPATLVMLGQNVRITTTVVPLEPGNKGQCILVRDLTTARVMKAEVVGEGLLQASF